MALPSFMKDIVANTPHLNHGNYPTIPYRTDANAPYSPREAKTTGHKQAPAKAGVTKVSSAGKRPKQVSKPSRKGK